MTGSDDKYEKLLFIIETDQSENYSTDSKHASLTLSTEL